MEHDKVVEKTRHWHCWHVAWVDGDWRETMCDIPHEDSDSVTGRRAAPVCPEMPEGTEDLTDCWKNH